MATLHEDLYVYMILPSFFPTMGNVSDKNCTENKTHNLRSVTYFPKIAQFMR
jgi:hypothetical protein